MSGLGCDTCQQEYEHWVGVPDEPCPKTNCTGVLIDAVVRPAPPKEAA